MQHVMETGEPLAPVAGAPWIGGSRVSWGAVLAGTVTMLAIAVILMSLAIAVISLAMHPTVPSLKGTGMSLWICGMASTLIGAFVGGRVAGLAPRTASVRLAMVHGFVAWGLALLTSVVFQLGVMRGSFEAAAETIADAMLAEQATMGGEIPGAIPGEGAMPGESFGEERIPAPPRADQTRGARIAINYLRGASWSWFGTWLASGILAVAGAGLARRGRMGEPKIEPEPATPSARPLTPAPTA
jgi:hypothetical protein